MKEKECDHFVDSIIYLIEQTAIYNRTKAIQLFDDLKIGLTFDQYCALDAVSINEGICQRDLAKLILKDRSYTTRLATMLEDKGLIFRKIEEKGSRLVKRLYLTEAGINVISKNQENLKDISTEIFKEMTDEEFNTLRNTLEKLKQCISKYTVMPL